MSPGSVSVRPAERADVPEIFGLIRELAEFERLLDTFEVTADRLESHMFGPRPFVSGLVGLVDGSIEGYALYFHNYSTFLGRPGVYLEDLFVRPTARGGGLGRALLAGVAEVCVSVGGPEARLEWAVLDWNRPAIDFYESLGAQPNSTWLTYRLAGEPLARLASSSI